MDTPQSMVFIASLLVTGTMVGSELAVIAFFHPALYGLPDDTHARAAQVFAARLGKAMPPWYAATLLLLLVAAWQRYAAGGLAFGAAIVAAALMLGVLVFTIALMVPVNNRIAALSAESLTTGWKNDRRQWDAMHRGRVVALLLIFVLLLVSVVAPGK